MDNYRIVSGILMGFATTPLLQGNVSGFMGTAFPFEVKHEGLTEYSPG